ncbi:MAG: chorismate synthase [Bacillota bacterium]
MFEYLTAGESHGPSLTAIIKNIPSGLILDLNQIDYELERRQRGYGRGQRMEIEKDKAKITSGLRHGKTLGSPLTINIKNNDWENWKEIMALRKNKDNTKKVTKPRPGHADLAGIIKYNFSDIRNVLERASARETAVRTAVGAIAKQFLNEFDIKVKSHVTQIGSISSANWKTIKNKKEYFKKVEKSPLRCGNKKKTKNMINLLNSWSKKGDSAGGIIEVIVFNPPAGLGSHTHWDKKLDGKLAAALMSIQAIKGVELSSAFENSKKEGSKVHDEIFYDENKGYYRKTNRAGGLEGGMTNGENIIIHLAMKPIPTLAKALHSVDIDTKEEKLAAKERSDICAVPSASIVSEAVTAIVLAKAFCNKFAGDTMKEIKSNFRSYKNYLMKNR